MLILIIIETGLVDRIALLNFGFHLDWAGTRGLFCIMQTALV